MITVERDGYAPVSVTVERHRSASVLQNFVWLHPLGIIAGIITDLSTGSGYNLRPDDVSVTLAPIAAHGPTSGDVAARAD
jgi:hypothetical protein